VSRALKRDYQEEEEEEEEDEEEKEEEEKEEEEEVDSGVPKYTIGCSSSASL